MRRSLCPRRLKKLCFCTASHVLIARLAVQIQSFFNILGQNGRRVTKDYSSICTGDKPHTFNFSASISSLYAFTQRASWDRVLHAKSRKVIWDMINTLFVTTVAVEPTFVAILCTRKHMKICPCVIYPGWKRFFWRGFRFLSSLFSDPPTAENTENSRRTREKPLVPRVCVILSNFFEEQCTQSHPQLLSWLSRTHFSTTFLEKAVFMHVTSFHCKPVKLYVCCIWCDTPNAVRYEQMPKSRYYCL